MLASLFAATALCVAAEPPKLDAAEARKDALAKYGVAMFNLRRERLLTAVKQFEAAAKADPDATEPLKELVRLYAQLGREPQAIRIARKILDADPDDHDTALLLARLLFDAGDLKEAVAAAKRAAASKRLPGRADKAVRVYRELAAICEKANDLATAEDALRKAIEMLTDRRAMVVAASAFTPKEADTEAAECYERLGHVLLKRGKAPDAIEAFRAAAKLYADPNKADDPTGAARLGWNLSGVLEASDPAASLKYLESFLKLQPKAAEPYQRLAALLRALGRDADVVRTLKAYADRDRTNYPLAAVLAAELARDRATRAEGDKLFAAVLEVTADPKVVAVFVRSCLETRRPLEIIEAIDRAFVKLKEDRKNETPETPAEAAAKAFAAERATAIAAALASDPRGVADLLLAAGDDLRAGVKRARGTYFFLGALAARNHKLDDAAVHFRTAARLARDQARYDAYEALLNVLWRAAKPAEVEEACREAIRAGLFPVVFHFHLCLALAEQGRADAAVAVADKMVEQAADTDRLTVRLRKHAVLRTLGKWDDAIVLGKSLAGDYDSPADRQRVRYAQAAAYWGAKKPAEAEAQLRAILDDDPDHAPACNDLGYHLADQGRNLDEAERLVRHALEVDRIERKKAGSAEPESGAYRDSLGWVLFRRGKLPEAKAELEAAAALPDGARDPVVWDHLGDVYFRLGDKPSAKAAWEKAKTLYEADPRLSSRTRHDGRPEEVKRKLTRVP